MKISASVYSSKEGSLKEIVQNLDAHGIDYLHIDCKDNFDVFDDIEEIRNYSNTPIDLHLITNDPERYYDRINALNIELVTLQYEDLSGFRYKGGLKSKMGLSIVTHTPLSAIEVDFDSYDFVLMMATTPGESGGRFDKFNFRKIREFKKSYPSKSVHIDGGVNAEVSFILRNMGVHSSVVGSYLFKDQPLGAALLNLKTHDIDSHYSVGDFMRLRDESPIVVITNRNLKTVLQSIDDFKLGFTILEDENQILEGIVSNADLRRELLRNVDNPTNISLERMINTNPISVQEKTTVTDMLAMLKQFDFPINYMPVVDEDNKLKGVVSFLNLVKGEL
jgi:ribulose-phosphate 3-epimerase